MKQLHTGDNNSSNGSQTLELGKKFDLAEAINREHMSTTHGCGDEINSKQNFKEAWDLNFCESSLKPRSSYDCKPLSPNTDKRNDELSLVLKIPCMNTKSNNSVDKNDNNIEEINASSDKTLPKFSFELNESWEEEKEKNESKSISCTQRMAKGVLDTINGNSGSKEVFGAFRCKKKKKKIDKSNELEENFNLLAENDNNNDLFVVETTNKNKLSNQNSVSQLNSQKQNRNTKNDKHSDFKTPTKSSTEALYINDDTLSTTEELLVEAPNFLEHKPNHSKPTTACSPLHSSKQQRLEVLNENNRKNFLFSSAVRAKASKESLPEIQRFRSSSYHECCEQEPLQIEQTKTTRYKSMTLLNTNVDQKQEKPAETCERLMDDYRLFSSCIQVKEAPSLTSSSSLKLSTDGRTILKMSSLLDDDSYQAKGAESCSQTQKKCSLPNPSEPSNQASSRKWRFCRGFQLTDQRLLNRKAVKSSLKQLSSRRIITKARSKWDFERLRVQPFYQPQCLKSFQKNFPWYKDMLESGAGPWVSARSFEVPYQNILPEIIFRWKNQGERSFLILRLVVTAILFGGLFFINIILKAELYGSDHLDNIWDLLHLLTVPINQIFHKNDILFSTVILISSFLMDAVVVLVWMQWALLGDSFRLPLAYSLFYIIRSIMRVFCILPYPNGYIWHVPTFGNLPIYSLSVPYQATNDFFFSGHVGCCVLASSEHFHYRFWWGFYFSVFVGVIEFCVLTLTRGHYTIDMLSGALIAHWTHMVSKQLVRPLDQWLALPPRLVVVKESCELIPCINEKVISSLKLQN